MREAAGGARRHPGADVELALSKVPKMPSVRLLLDLLLAHVLLQDVKKKVPKMTSVRLLLVLLLAHVLLQDVKKKRKKETAATA